MLENTFLVCLQLHTARSECVSLCVCVVADVSLSIDKHTHILRSTPVVFSQLSFRITNTQKTKQKPYKHLGTAVTDAKDANAAHLYQNKQL